MSMTYLNKYFQLVENQYFLDFYSFEDLCEDEVILKSLINTYRNIFSESEVWNEYYSYEEVLNNLKNQLAGHAMLRVCVSTHRSGK